MSKGRLTEYIVDCSPNDSREIFSRMLEGKGFSAREWRDGYIFFRPGENIYNEKEPSAEVFFLPAVSVRNSFDVGTERAALKKLDAALQNFLSAEGLGGKYIDCTVVFRHDALTAEEIRFYHTFGGVWFSEEKGGRDVSSRAYGCCGLDRGRGRLYGPVEEVTDASGSPAEMMLLLTLEAECVPYRG